MEELKFGQGGSTNRGGLGGQCDSLSTASNDDDDDDNDENESFN